MAEADRRARQIIEEYFGENLDPAIYSELKPHFLRGGEWLFRQGDPGDSLYFVVRGRLQAVASGEGHPEPGRLLGDVKPGDSVGEAGLLTGAPRAAGIRAIRDSLLIRLDSEAFQRLSREHPGMVMQLAGNVATMMQKNLANPGGAARNFTTITLMSLHDTASVRTCMEQLASGLEKASGAGILNPAKLGQLGAPQEYMGVAGELPDGLKQWLSDQETEHPMVVYLCHADESPWTHFALRQADVIALVGENEGDPEPGALEQTLLSGDSAPSGRMALVLLHSGDQPPPGTHRWLESRNIDHQFHLNPKRPDQIARVARVVSGTATGLVLGGGAMRAVSGLGAYKALQEAGIPIDWVGGSGIGSLIGVAIARNWSADRVTALAEEVLTQRELFDPGSLPITTEVGMQSILGMLAPLLEGNIEDLPNPFFCVSTNLDRGVLQVHDQGDLATAVRASSAMPGILPPILIDDEPAVDGSVLNSLPVDVMQRYPVAQIIAVDAASHAHRPLEEVSSEGTDGGFLSRLLPSRRPLKTTDLASVVLRTSELGTLATAAEHGRQADLLLRPDLDEFAMTDVGAFTEIVETGYRHTLQELEGLRAGPGPDHD